MKKRIWIAVSLIACMIVCVLPALGGCDGPKTDIALDKPAVTVYVGEEEQIMLQGASGQTVVWKSSDESVATVEAEGIGAYIKGISAGSTTVTASIGGEEAAVCEVTVKDSPLYVFLPDGGTGSLKNGRLVLLKNGTATVKAISDVPLTGTPEWRSSDESVGTVNYQGLICLVTAVARGECTITVECDGYRASFTLYVGKTAS